VTGRPRVGVIQVVVRGPRPSVQAGAAAGGSADHGRLEPAGAAVGGAGVQEGMAAEVSHTAVEDAAVSREEQRGRGARKESP